MQTIDKSVRPLRGLRSLGLAIAIAVVSYPVPSQACSTFCLRDGEHVVFGKNYDWNVGEGLLIVNPRNVARVADVVPPETPARWRARYGSVTFNQYGREFPSGGINEAGLVIELMWLDAALYPRPDERPAVGALQWIQYQLDTAASVADVIASDAEIRIGRASPLHFLVADRHGEVATIEFIDHRLLVHTGDALPVAVLTNSIYDSSLLYLQWLDDEDRPVPTYRSSGNRFARASRRVREAPQGTDPETLVRYAFDTLDAVAQGPSTQWSIVYEADALRLHFRTHRHRQIKTLSLADLDFSCHAPARMLDLQTRIGGEVGSRLEIYRQERNRQLIEASYRQTDFLARIPDRELDRISKLPEALRCEE
ncbi:MAG: linear amide C-N hydrolase [Acidobacteriota bacterium]